MKKTIIALSIITALTAVLALTSYRPTEPRENIVALRKLPDSQFVQVGELQVHYRDVGRGDTVVLLHGNGANLYHFEPIIDELSQQYRVISLDYIGHGLTGANPGNDYSSDAFVSFFEQFFDALSLERFTLVGHSMGGYWSMMYTQANPDDVSKLILIDAYGGRCQGREYGVPFVPENIPGVSLLTPYFLPAFVVRSELEKNVFRTEAVTDELVALHHDLASIDGNRLYRKHFFDYDHPRDAIDASRLAAPIYLIWGEQDAIHPVCEMKDLQRRLPVVQTRLLADTGHLPTIENPDGVVHALMQYLSAP